jgi:hypothetical protein
MVRQLHNVVREYEAAGGLVKEHSPRALGSSYSAHVPHPGPRASSSVNVGSLSNGSSAGWLAANSQQAARIAEAMPLTWRELP